MSRLIPYIAGAWGWGGVIAAVKVRVSTWQVSYTFSHSAHSSSSKKIFFRKKQDSSQPKIYFLKQLYFQNVKRYNRGRTGNSGDQQMNIEQRIKAKAKEFDTLDEACCVEIVLNAKALTIEECFDFLLIDQVSLTEAENKFARLLHARGRAIGIKDAADKLFSHMATRNGGQSALEYLKQCSGDFSVEVSQGGSAGGFQFNVTIPEPGRKANAIVSNGS